VPFATCQDALRGIEDVQGRVCSVWVRLGMAFQQVDTEGSGLLSYEQFHGALAMVDRKMVMVEEEVERLFARADKENRRLVDWREFQHDLGMGTQAMPEFMKPRQCRQAGAERLWQWDHMPQGTNSQRKFHIIDEHGHTRYHCKPCHQYMLRRCFSEEAIASKLHYCSNCLEAIKQDRVPGRHTHKLPPSEWPRAERSRHNEPIGTCTTSELQTLRNGKRQPLEAPWAEDLDIGRHNQFERGVVESAV